MKKELLCLLAFVLAACALMAWAPGEALPRQAAGGEGAAPAEGFFAVQRERREVTRGQQSAYYTDVMEKMPQSEEALFAAQEKRSLAKRADAELACESWLVAKGFADAFILCYEGGVQAAIRGEALSEKELGQVLEAVCRICEVEASDVYILCRP